MQQTEEMWVQFLGQLDPLEEGMATGNPLHYSCLENAQGRRSMGGATVHSVTESLTQLKQLTAHCWSHSSSSEKDYFLTSSDHC